MGIVHMTNLPKLSEEIEGELSRVHHEVCYCGSDGKLGVHGSDECGPIRESLRQAMQREVEAARKENDKKRWDAEGVLASVADALNIWCRQEGVQEVEQYLTLDVRDGLNRLCDKLMQKVEAARREGADEAMQALATRCRQEEQSAVTLAFIETVDLDRLLRDCRSLPLSDKATEEKGGEHDSRG